MKKRSRQNRAVRDEWVDDASKDTRLQQYMEKISQHIHEGTQWKGPEDLDPEAEFEQRLLERRERHYRTVKEDSQRAQDKLKAKEEELNGHEENLQQRREARRAQLDLDRQERERQLKEQEESRKKRREHIERRQMKMEEEERQLDEQERDRQQIWRQRQADQLARREQEFARREEEWQQWEGNERQRREDDRAVRIREDEENARRREEVLAADAEVERLRKAQEEAEIDAYVQKSQQEALAIEKEAAVGEVLRRHVRSASSDVPTLSEISSPSRSEISEATIPEEPPRVRELDASHAEPAGHPASNLSDSVPTVEPSAAQ
jgi:hypothetical protein